MDLERHPSEGPPRNFRHRGREHRYDWWISSASRKRERPQRASTRSRAKRLRQSTAIDGAAAIALEVSLDRALDVRARAGAAHGRRYSGTLMDLTERRFRAGDVAELRIRASAHRKSPPTRIGKRSDWIAGAAARRTPSRSLRWGAGRLELRRRRSARVGHVVARNPRGRPGACQGFLSNGAHAASGFSQYRRAAFDARRASSGRSSVRRRALVPDRSLTASRRRTISILLRWAILMRRSSVGAVGALVRLPVSTGGDARDGRAERLGQLDEAIAKLQRRSSRRAGAA